MWVTQSIEGDYSTVVPHSSLGLIAAASRDGIITLFEEDLQISQVLTVKKDNPITNLNWHPSRKLLVICWSDG
jgi:hypothetical protein